MNNATNKLINDLCHNLPPTKRLAMPFVRAGQWLCAALLIITIGVLLQGPRNDLGQVVQTTPFILETLLIFSAGTSATFAAFYLNVPGYERRWYTLLFAMLPVIFWLSYLGYTLYSMPVEALTSLRTSLHPSGLHHLLEIILYTAVPGTLIFIALRRGLTLNPTLVGVLAMIAATTLAQLGCRYICPVDAPAHLLIWHIIPGLILVISGATLGQKLLMPEKK